MYSNNQQDKNAPMFIFVRFHVTMHYGRCRYDLENRILCCLEAPISSYEHSHSYCVMIWEMHLCTKKRTKVIILCFGLVNSILYHAFSKIRWYLYFIFKLEFSTVRKIAKRKFCLTFHATYLQVGHRVSYLALHFAKPLKFFVRFFYQRLEFLNWFVDVGAIQLSLKRDQELVRGRKVSSELQQYVKSQYLIDINMCRRPPVIRNVLVHDLWL